MALFDPRRVLRQICNPLLREYFRRREELGDVPWDELTERAVEPIYAACEALPAERWHEVLALLRNIDDLADQRGVAVLAEEVLLYGRAAAAGEFQAQASRQSKAMWAHLHLPHAFAAAAVFARADALAGGRSWRRRNGLPQTPIKVTGGTIEGLERALSDFYGPSQMRGRLCHVAHYRRGGGADYFFAYLDDYPDKRMEFDGQSAEPAVRVGRYAFDNIFVYSAEEGSLDVYAKGGRKVWEPLQAAFCGAVLGCAVEPADPLKPTYRLDHLLAPDHPLPTDPGDGVEEARITRMRLVPRGSGGYIEVKSEPRASRGAIYRDLERHMKAEAIAPGATRVDAVSFSFRFAQRGLGRGQTMSVDVSTHSSNLKSKPDEQRVIGERCLRRWGVIDDR